MRQAIALGGRQSLLDLLASDVAAFLRLTDRVVYLEDNDIVTIRANAYVIDTLADKPVLRVGDLLLDPATRQVSRGSRAIELTPKEYALLRYLMENAGLTDRVVTDEKVADAVVRPPQTTRARLRGAFIKAAKARKRDFTVDWVHLKLNDQAQRTVMCKDPFKAHDERVEKLIASL